MLTILAALNDELQLIKSETEIDKAIHIRPFAIFIGKYQGQDVALVRTSIGKGSMATAISYCIENLKTSLFMNIGYAGGLDPRLHTGDIVIASSVIDGRSEKTITIDEELVKGAISRSEAQELPYHIVKIVTVERPIADPHDKAYIGTKFEAQACDMESAPFAEALSSAGRRFLIVRAILDTMDTIVPAIPEDAVADGEIIISRFLGHLKNQPGDILKLPKFSYLRTQARIAMTNFVKEWIRHERAV